MVVMSNAITLSELQMMLEKDVLHALDLVKKNRQDLEQAERNLKNSKDEKKRVYWEEEIKRLQKWRLQHSMPPIIVYGDPGVGKTQCISWVVREMVSKYGIRVGLIVSQMSTYDMIAVRGMPIPDRESGTTKWLPQDSFPNEHNCADYDVVVWFMDELTAAPKSVQPPLYSLLQFGSIENGITIPPNVMIVAAGNDKDDRAIVSDMSSALANRLVHFDVQVSLDSWKDWALREGIHPMIIAFHNSNEGQYLHKMQADTTGLIKGFPSPRTWHRVSDDLVRYADNERLREARVIGHVGPEAGVAFNTFFRVHDQLPNPENILNGQLDKVPEEDHMIYATLSNLVAHLLKKYDATRIDNFFSYVEKATAHRKEIGYVAVQDFIRGAGRDATKIMLQTKNWSKWADTIIKMDKWT